MSNWDAFWLFLFGAMLLSIFGGWVIDVIEAIGRARCHDCHASNERSTSSGLPSSTGTKGESTTCGWLETGGCSLPAAYVSTYPDCDCGGSSCTAYLCVEHAAQERADAAAGLVTFGTIRSLS